MSLPAVAVAGEARREDVAMSAGAGPSAFRARRIMLASHGTPGARAAEQAALHALERGGLLHHLIIIPEFWRHMSGDGWRINASTEHAFCDYLEGQIEAETRAELQRVHGDAVARGLSYRARSETGPLAETLIGIANAGDYELVMIGAPRPRGQVGLRSRMDVAKLVRGLRVPLVIVPIP